MQSLETDFTVELSQSTPSPPGVHDVFDLCSTDILEKIWQALLRSLISLFISF